MLKTRSIKSLTESIRVFSLMLDRYFAWFYYGPLIDKSDKCIYFCDIKYRII